VCFIFKPILTKLSIHGESLVRTADLAAAAVLVLVTPGTQAIHVIARPVMRDHLASIHHGCVVGLCLALDRVGAHVGCHVVVVVVVCTFSHHVLGLIVQAQLSLKLYTDSL
jgi:hypothetical protein